MSDSISCPDTARCYAYVSIGANLPSRSRSPEQAIAFAFDQIAELSTSAVLKSSIFSTSPIDSPPGTPDFLNALAAIIPDQKETPLSLLHKLQAIENAAGRTRSGIRNEARTLDLDLIAFGNERLVSAELILPHPRAHQRKFVLEPLIEIAGKAFILPGMSETLSDLLEQIDDRQVISKK